MTKEKRYKVLGCWSNGIPLALTCSHQGVLESDSVAEGSEGRKQRREGNLFLGFWKARRGAPGEPCGPRAVQLVRGACCPDPAPARDSFLIFRRGLGDKPFGNHSVSSRLSPALCASSSATLTLPVQTKAEEGRGLEGRGLSPPLGVWRGPRWACWPTEPGAVGRRAE